MKLDHCKRCGKPIFWAKHERSGKAAPLCRPEGDMPANINLVGVEPDVAYTIVKAGEGEFVNHFSNCKFAKEFRGQ